MKNFFILYLGKYPFKTNQSVEGIFFKILNAIGAALRATFALVEKNKWTTV